MMNKPVILIPQENPPKNYVYALNLADLAYEHTFSPKNLEKYSGLLLTGGGDFLSIFYNCSVACKNVNILRDVNEFKILDYFYKNNLPILGICRGMQIINVYLGGNLKNVDCHQSKTGDDVFHPTFSSCKFFSNLNSVNSNHRQCVDKLNPLATDVLTSNDGVIEGFLTKNVIAVQFHPERMSEKAISIIYGEFAKLAYNYFTCRKS